MSGKALLILGGGCSFALAILHVIIIFVGVPAYQYFGAGENTLKLVEAGSFLPTIRTLSIAIALFIFGIFSFSGAGIIKPVAHIKIALPVIGCIYTIRGLVLVVQMAQMIGNPVSMEPRELTFSLVSLLVGIFILAGTRRNWDYIVNISNQ